MSIMGVMWPHLEVAYPAEGIERGSSPDRKFELIVLKRTVRWHS